MLYKFNIKHTCIDENCGNNIQKKIEAYLEKPIENNGHISISHEKNNHKIWLFLYDKDKKHESESKGKIIIQDSNNKKWTGKKPILNELEKLKL